MSVISLVLASDGFMVRGFTDPLKVLEFFSDLTAQGDLVVSDVRMPGISGLELARRLKTLKPDIKIVLMTSFEINKGEFEKVLPNIHIDGFLKKPFNNSHLLETIKTL